MSSLFLQEWSIYSVTDHNHVIQGLFLVIHAAEWRFHPLIVRSWKLKENLDLKITFYYVNCVNIHVLSTENRIFFILKKIF